MPMLEVRAAAALFDMDGTLVDSTAVVEHLWTLFCDANGVDARRLIPFSHGRPTRQTLDHFLPAMPADEREAIALELDRRELEVLDGIVAVRGAATLLDQLDIPWAVVTSATRELAVRRMAAAGLPMPEVMVPADEVRHGKPHPEGYLTAAGQLGVPVSECVVLEDAEPGVRAGLDAGARVVVVGELECPDLDRVPDLTRLTLLGR